jgi:hypothetical protein
MSCVDRILPFSSQNVVDFGSAFEVLMAVIAQIVILRVGASCLVGT